MSPNAVTISLRRAEKYEARYYFETAEDYFRKGR
jgi:hypothetical protein